MSSAMGIEGVQERVSLPAERGGVGLEEKETHELTESLVVQERDEQSHESLTLLLVRSCRERKKTPRVIS